MIVFYIFALVICLFYIYTCISIESCVLRINKSLKCTSALLRQTGENCPILLNKCSQQQIHGFTTVHHMEKDVKVFEAR